jgi:hypothetical protein
MCQQIKIKRSLESQKSSTISMNPSLFSKKMSRKLFDSNEEDALGVPTFHS